MATAFGEATFTGKDKFNLDLTAYSYNGGWSNDFGYGEISGDVISVYFDDGEMVGTKIAAFQQGISLDALADTYNIINSANGDNVGTFTIKPNGIVEGRTLNGCEFSGELWIPDSQFNQFAIDMNASGCGLNSTVSGVGHRTSKGAAIALSDNWYGIPWLLER